MNEPCPGAAPVESSPPPPPYHDRSTGLLVFGVLTILLGGLAALFAVLMLAQTVFGGAMNPPGAPSPSLNAMCVYVILAAALVWLGIGSIQARRWARALLLVFSWSWLILGVVVLLFLMFFLPRVMESIPAGGAPGQPAVNRAAVGIAMVFVFLIFGVLFVILPAVWTFFYNSRHVKATCEARDPVARWTDACPLPVLACCSWLMFGVPMMVIMPVTGQNVVPFFGVFLTGLPSAMYCLVMAALWAYAAWSLYKLETRGWWVVFIMICLMAASTLTTFARHDVMEMYRLLNYSEVQIEQIQKSGLLEGNRMSWMMLFCMLPFLGYLLFIRRYLRCPGGGK
ncbi:MAG: hypothetical protein ABSA47_11910 [Verrucomicrobiota bacterium]